MGTSEEKEVSRASAHQGLIEVSSTLIALSDGHPSQRGSKSLTGANYVAAWGSGPRPASFSPRGISSCLDVPQSCAL
jgi:hypothetical protein